MSDNTEKVIPIPGPPEDDLCDELYEKILHGDAYKSSVDDWTCKWIGILVENDLSGFSHEDYAAHLQNHVTSERLEEIRQGSALEDAELAWMQFKLAVQSKSEGGVTVVLFTTETENEEECHYLQCFGDWGTPLGWQGPWLGLAPDYSSFMSPGQFLYFEGDWIDHAGNARNPKEISIT